MLTEYLTIQGDRWDTVSYKAYGDATLFYKIQDANPNLPLTDYFEGGITLLIPIVENPVSTDASLLPPWKRIDPALATAQTAILDQLSNSNSNGSFDQSFD